MKRILHFSFVLLLALVMLSVTGCTGITIQDEGLVIGETYRLESGETVNHDLTIIGGDATLDEDSTVDGDLSIIGGNVSIDGTVDGDVSVTGGYVYLDDNAVITGDLVTLGGTVNRSSQAQVEGVERSDRPTVVLPWMRTMPVAFNFDPITGPLMAFFQALALAALAIVMQLFASTQMDRVGRTALTQPVVSGGIGLLTIVVAPALLVILAITIILIPLSLVGILALGLAVLFGWLALGLLVGRQLAIWLKQSWSDPISAGVGTLALSLLSSMLNLIPCLGWMANALIWLVALGAALLTRFGTQPYPTLPASPRPAAPYAPPVQATEPAPAQPAPSQPAAEPPLDPGGENI